MRTVTRALACFVWACYGHGVCMTSDRRQRSSSRKHQSHWHHITHTSHAEAELKQSQSNRQVKALATLLLAVCSPTAGWLRAPVRHTGISMHIKGDSEQICPPSAGADSKGTGRLRPEIILFGDSITQESFAPGGWGARLTNAYCRHVDITLRGYSGYNTRWALQVVPRIFTPEAPAPILVTILLGANDASLPSPLKGQPESASRYHVPIDEYIDNLRKILQAPHCMGDGSARILLITPPPVDDAKWGDHCPLLYGVAPNACTKLNFETTKRYADACVELGIETNTPTLDLHSAFEAHDNWPSLLYDGLHPNAEGGELIAKEVLKAIKMHFPDMVPAWYPEDGIEAGKLPQDFPDHKAIDHEHGNVEGSFAAHAKRLGH